MKIAILGAGAMGQFFGAHLLAAGHDVILLDSSKEVRDAINRHGIKVISPSREFQVRGRAAEPQNLGEPVDLVFVFTKSFQSDEAVAAIRHLIRDQTIGISLQNGLGNEISLLKVFRKDQIVVGVTDFPSDRAQDGVIHTEAMGQVIVGGIDASGDAPAQLVAEILDKSGLNAQHHSTVTIPIWEKAIFNTVYNSVTAAAGLCVRDVFDEPEAEKLATAILDESLNVARAEGVAIDEARVQQNIAKAYQHHANHRTSMLVDIEAGRKTEIETIGGAIERIGAANGTPTPTLSVLCSVIRLREKSNSR